MNAAEFWGEPISTYSRAEAIADGALLDVTGPAREVGFTRPMAVTAGLADALGCGVLRCPSALDRLDRALRAVRTAIANAPRGADRVTLDLEGAQGPVAAWALCGPGDGGEPVLTVMLVGED